MLILKKDIYLSILIGLTALSYCFADDSEKPILPKESAVHLPKFPQTVNLKAFTVDEVTDFSFALDVSTLQVDKDGITRYTVVIASRNGVQNIFYEGIRCITAEYKIFAYGTPEKTFIAKSEIDWEPIRRNERGWPRFRNTLYEYYFCDPERTERQLDKDSIIENLNHPRRKESN